MNTPADYRAAYIAYKWWILIAAGLFAIGLGTGLALTFIKPDVIAGVFEQDLAALRELSALLAPFQVSTAIFILVKNISAILISFILSPIFCLFPVLALIFNGLVVSFVGALAVEKASLGFVLLAIAPHGIIELPALIIGEAAALSFGAAAIMALFSERRRGLLVTNLRQNLKYLGIACVLLVPAAIIETFVTPLFLS